MNLRQKLTLLTDHQRTMMIYGCLHNYKEYSYSYQNKKLMYICGSYGRCNVDKYTIDKLPTEDKLEVLVEILTAQGEPL